MLHIIEDIQMIHGHLFGRAIKGYFNYITNVSVNSRTNGQVKTSIVEIHNAND